MFSTASRKIGRMYGSSAAWNVTTAKKRASTSQRARVSAFSRVMIVLEWTTRATMSTMTARKR